MAQSDILCIHYYFPPVRSGAVLRNYYFANTYSAYFKNVHVITSENAKTREQEPLPLNNNILRYEVKTWDYRSLKRYASHKPTGKKTSSTFQFLTKIQKTLPFHFLLGEGSIIYIWSAYKKAIDLIQKHDVKVVYSSFMPYADHLIAHLLKKRFPDIIWVADFRDLQIEPMYKNIYFEKLNIQIEKYLLKNVNLITTISPPFADRLSTYGPSLSVPKGVNIRTYKKKQNSTFKIVYTGHLAGHYRDGKFLVALLKKLHKNYPNAFEFVYAGRDGATWQKWIDEAGLKTCFNNLGFISRKATLKLQEESDLLVLLTSSTPEYKGVFTGKLFEYLETKSPILNIINGIHDDTFEALFNAINAGIICYSKDGILGAYNYIKSLYLKEHVHHKNTVVLKEKYSWNYQIERLLKTIEIL